MEEWKPIKDFPNYLISNLGNVRNKKFNRKLAINFTGEYPYVGLHSNGKRTFKKIHQLVATAFCNGYQEGYEPNHKDGNKLNNNSDNLEWTTKSKNVAHAYATGLKKPSGPHPIRPVKIIETGQIFNNASDVAKYINGDHSTVSKVLRGENKSHKGYTYEYTDEMINLYPHQEEAVNQLGNGKILHGHVGSGKTVTALAYYVAKESPKNIMVITTSKHRDSLFWEETAAKFGIGDVDFATLHGVIECDSWQNIAKYEHYEDTFFIFDEAHVGGSGAWVRSFLKIVKNKGNTWIVCSATPGDNWLQYAPIFIANNYYKNLTAFKHEHVQYEAFRRYPKVKAYLNETKLQLLRNEILVEMPFIRHTTRYVNDFEVGYDRELFDLVYKKRWNPFEDKPIKDVAEMFRLMRKVVNIDPSRLEAILYLMKAHDRIIIYYSYNYELQILRTLSEHIFVAELNGHRHDPLPNSNRWIYLVQYIAGAEAWNATSTDAMAFYSLTYSYKNFQQAQGRIDRINTSYTSLYYYVLVSDSLIDKAVRSALTEKRNFNEKKYARETMKIDV